MKQWLALGVLFFVSSLMWAQTFTVYGYLKDATNQEALAFGAVKLKGTTKGAVANELGYFSLTSVSSESCIEFSFIGYDPQVRCVTLQQDTLLVVSLQPTTRELKEVVVSGDLPLHEQVLLGFQKVPIQTIKELPAFLGEPDVLRAITLIPGVVTGREGFGNLLVRGGDRGQNLVLLDGMPLYNTSHLGGFIGAINSRAIKDVEVYKGGFPARYGGRASSVIDIRTRDGNKNQHEASAHIGLVNSGFSVEGPLIKGTTSYHLTGRSSYLDLILLPLRIQVEQAGEGSYAGYTFFDINGKLTHQFSDRNKVFLTGYMGRDRFQTFDVFDNGVDNRIETEGGFNISQDLLTLGQQYNISPTLFWEQRLGYTQYRTGYDLYLLEYNRERYLESGLDSESQIRSTEYQTKFLWNPKPSHEITMGFHGLALHHNPGILSTSQRYAADAPLVDTVLGEATPVRPILLNGFVEDKINLNSAINIIAGLRYSHYLLAGQRYATWEPRASMRIALNNRSSFKVNYSRMAQYTHLLVDATVGLEREVWVMSDEEVPPQLAQQVSMGVYHAHAQNWEVGAEAYFKWMENVLFLPITGSLGNISAWSDRVVQGGIGRAYGMEVFGSYETSRASATLAYTLAWSLRQFEGINLGNWFPHQFDRRHNVTLTGQWKINTKHAISSNFVLHSGTPFTLPTGYIPGSDVLPEQYITPSIHNIRLPTYHRLDLAYRRSMKVPAWAESGFWSVSIYNVYARQNPGSYFWRNGELYQRTDILIIPSFQFGITF